MDNFFTLENITNLDKHISQDEIDILTNAQLSANMMAEKPDQFRELIVKIMGPKKALEFFQQVYDAILEHQDD